MVVKYKIINFLVLSYPDNSGFTILSRFVKETVAESSMPVVGVAKVE